jgi:hypothetical protein
MIIKRNDMKKSEIAIVVAGIVLLAGCSFGKRHTTIVENTNNHRIRIEYSGHIYFNKDETAISSISRNGYLEYQNDERKLNAKNDGHGGVSYELYEGYTKVYPDAEGKKFIAEAIKVIVQKAGHNLNMN